MKTESRTALLHRVAVCFAFALASEKSYALVLVYEQAGFGHSVGEVASQHSVTINIANWEAATTYTGAAGMPLPLNTTRGFGQGGTGVQSVVGGVVELNSGGGGGVLVTQASEARPLGLYNTGAVSLDDSWGIGKVTDIRDSNGLIIWSPLGKNAEITALLFGAQDTYFKQTTPDAITVSGVGLRIDLWEQSLTAPAAQLFNPSAGPSARDAGGLGYTTATEGFRILRMESAPGFLHPNGILGGLGAEFEARYSVTGGIGGGDAFMNVTGGPEAARFDSNLTTSSVSAPGLYSDLFVTFSNDTRTLAQGNPTNKFDWTATSAGFLQTPPVPEPSSALAGIGCSLAMILGQRSGRRKRA